MQLFQPGPVVWIQELLGPGWEGVLGIVSALGSVWGILLAAGLALWIFGRPALHAVLVVVLVEAVAKKALAAAVPIPRPEAGPVIKYETVTGVGSFPSGHVSTATAVWAALTFSGRIPLVVPLVVGGAVGLSRLYRGVHWLTDVVAGLGLGLLMAAAGVWLYQRLDGRIESLSSRGWAGLGAALVGVAGIQVAFFLGSDNPFAWNGAGFLAGLGVALPALHRWVGDVPRPGGAGVMARRCLAGVGGLALLFTPGHLWTGAPMGVHGFLAFCGTVWTLVGAPLAFRRWPSVFGGRPPGRQAAAAKHVSTAAPPSPGSHPSRARGSGTAGCGETARHPTGRSSRG
ncbi:MAG: phosphatase PAP2 family protein [Gemmatimonadota bacterium]